MTLDDYLARKGNTQTGLADALGVHQTMIGHWTSGRARVTAERAIQIERVTDGVITKEELRPDLWVFRPPAEAFR